MTDHKFTDDDVIKALRELQEMSKFTPPICHYEKDITEPPFCKPFEQFQNDVKVALALIKYQKAEIERLQAVHADMTESLRLAAEANKDMQAEIKRLETENKLLTENDVRNKYPNCVSVEKGRIYTRTLEDYDELIGDISAEAIKEFAERLKANMSNIARMEYGGNTYFCVGYDLIDNLVKEMTEDHKESQNT